MRLFCTVNSINATSVSRGDVLIRLVNHSRRHTAKMKVLSVDGIPHLCLFAICDVIAGQQSFVWLWCEELTISWQGNKLYSIYM